MKSLDLYTIYSSKIDLKEIEAISQRQFSVKRRASLIANDD